VALEQLASLNQATRSIGEDGFTKDALKKIHRALKFLEEEVSVHNRSEEDALFPVLERYVEGPTERMREDHKVLKKWFVLLRKAVTRIEKTPASSVAVAELSRVSRELVQLFVNHIHKENHILFPLVQKFLTKDALREVTRRML